ncbi:hypothetical protein BV25DRAFT_1291788 [Artomyces pyxidatus]|uniref:Uncharacterized protein n=1 Tax=Artomyces pyxidatus TaxID=48021 RepID=A0ACB8SQN8_9AGAM|nr:hypothetical protein BV25DRAFT_1291788 [Artomyces pyxidatus]
MSLLPPEKQPRTFKLSVKALLSLPYRLCNPPPAVGKVRSCKVTPMFKVKLEDVLNRKHLPPLGLKDFEEWLLFVENSAENLYFILWLKEYVVRYEAWVAESRAKLDAHHGDSSRYRFSTAATPSPALTLFYLRAKQTFFTPGSLYELDIPSDVLAPFHTGHFVSPHPDPIVFSPVAWEAHRMLKASLDRFVTAAYYNVGTNRALCGMLGGTTIALLGAVAPVAVNFANHRPRWGRVFALPGLWLGLTILLASLHGVCMMVYVFGDLRQLRKFELARPAISAPQPLPSTRPSISSPVVVYKSASSSPSSSADFILPYAYTHPRTAPLPYPPPSPTLYRPSKDGKPVPPTLSITIPAPAHVARPRSGSPHSSLSTPYGGSSSSSCSTESLPPRHAHEITVSPAYYDPDPAPEGPATRTGPDALPLPLHERAYIPPGYDAHTPECRSSRTCTAAFIRAFDYDNGSVSAFDAGKSELGHGDGFDFDALPVRAGACSCALQTPALASSIALPDSALDTTPGVKGALGRAQYKCNRVELNEKEKGPEDERERERLVRRRDDSAIASEHQRVRGVPAFGPLTRVLSPVVTRAQWEIVVRSAALSFAISLAVIGCLVAAPVGR